MNDYFMLYIESLNNTFSIVEAGNVIKFRYNIPKKDSVVNFNIENNNYILGYKKSQGVKYLFKLLNYNSKDNCLELEKIMEFKDFISIDDNNLFEKFEFQKIVNITENDFNELYNKLVSCVGKYAINNEESIDVVTTFESKYHRNRIFFGAPGTGKSYKLNKEKDDLLSNGGFFERVTFHPDYSYTNFVGVYKPVSSKNEKDKEEISYKFVPGPFLRVLVKALRKKNKSKPCILIIEEINRANVAAVFGDVFQLLDRDKEGVSEYPIETSEDMRKHLSDELGGEPHDYENIAIPSNMFIWATMNSADQGVFFMDTAFKRRWDFTYIGINNNENNLSSKKYTMGKGDYQRDINWNHLRRAINEKLLQYNVNEDKLLGPYFIEDNLDEDKFLNTFKNKVLMYLFEDAANLQKDNLFKGTKSRYNSILFSEICKDFDEKGVFIFNENIYLKFN